MPAQFFLQEIDLKLPNKRKLSSFLDALLHKHLEGLKKIKLHYILCSDEYLLGINQQFLKHDTFTDIITFDLSENEHEVQGEIYISIDRIRDNALKFATSENNELHRVIFHGALHLCGFGDKKPADKKLMTEQENDCLQKYFTSEN